MSAGMGSGTDAAGRGRAETVHVALLDEGLDVWRPVAARRLSGDMFLILGQDHDREVETWAFGPGTVVRCRRETRGGEPILVASEAVREATAT